MLEESKIYYPEGTDLKCWYEESDKKDPEQFKNILVKPIFSDEYKMFYGGLIFSTENFNYENTIEIMRPISDTKVIAFE